MRGGGQPKGSAGFVLYEGKVAVVSCDSCPIFSNDFISSIIGKEEEASHGPAVNVVIKFQVVRSGGRTMSHDRRVVSQS